MANIIKLQTTAVNLKLALTHSDGITIDWGDGKTEKFDSPASGISSSYPHSYEKSGLYEITITGNVTTIYTGEDSDFTFLDVSQNPLLKELSRAKNKLTVLDLSKNKVILNPTSRTAATARVPAQQANSDLQTQQMDLYNKLENISDHSYAQLKKRVQDKKLKASERLTKSELLTAKEYLTDYQKYPNGIPGKWNQTQYRLETFASWFNLDITEQLLKLFDLQQQTGTSLIPIKGISKIMQAKLRSLAIYDTAGLLIKGKTQERRNILAKSETLDVDVRLVNSWVKQADLWRVEGMTTDMAYLLVQIGVRHVEDLSKVDVNKAYPIIERLVLTQTDFTAVDRVQFQKLIDSAADLMSLLNLSKNNISLSIDISEDPPAYLFKEDSNTPIDPKTGGKIIRDGLDFLNNVPLVLPLPHAITGKIWKRSIADKDNAKTPFGDVSVKISGIAASSADKTDAEKTPSAYVDSMGNFRVILPEKLNLQEGVIITVSQDSWKQTFMKSAIDIINSVEEQRILEKYCELQEISDMIAYKETKPTRLDMLTGDKALIDFQISKTATGTQDMADLITQQSGINREIENLNKEITNIESEINTLENQYNSLKEEIIFHSNPHSTDLEIILKNLVSCDNRYEAKLGDFVVIDEIFKGYDTDSKKALPSVKLMGNDDEAIQLSTDTAPSRVFNYGMLQRLVEPAIGPKGVTRKILEEPVDVMGFKEQLYRNPNNYPQMSSLGIGYVLNMHQAWVPDGFALGTLLYSLVLAPGEEQRLIVRENTQSYAIMNNAEGVDSDNQTYELTQNDDTTAAYNYAVNQLMKANSNYDYNTHTDGFGGGYGGAANVSWGIFNLGSAHGFSGATSNSKGSGSAAASQSNAHNEASSAAQSFQHSIKSAANRISQSKRISISTATSEESNSVATKIIANHNHSHAMTIQYWEVMRRYRLETCIDGIDLVLFIPLKLIRFIPDGNYAPNLTNFNPDKFIKRYDVLLKYADNLFYALPPNYRTGLNLIKKYAAYPDWKMESRTAGMRPLVVTFHCDLLTFDDLTVSLTLKNRKGVIAGTAEYDRRKVSASHETRKDLRQEIRDIRNGKAKYVWEYIPTFPFFKPQSIGNPKVTCTFMLPAEITDDDLSHITLNYSCEGLEYTLYQNPDALKGGLQKSICDKALDFLNPTNILDPVKTIESLFGKNAPSYLPEAYRSPNVTLSANDILSLGAPIISNPNIESNENLGAMLSSSGLTSSVVITLTNSKPVLLLAELQEMEATMHHIASDTLHYSQIIWASLSDDERAMMLEQYTIDMNFDKVVSTGDDETGDTTAVDTINIPLLNCVNVKKLLGFYGNCILLPFTYPKELAIKLKKTAAEVQDSLYRYHTHYFRVPTTVISLPTDGMIGEAVLGETNVSEVIDLTRFWNWKDSPIDKMEITPKYLNSTDYLAGKTTPDITALNLQGATPATPVTVNDLLTALISKQTPKFENITALDQLKDVLNAGTTSASDGRKQVLATTEKLAELSVDILKNSKAGTNTAKTDTAKTDTAKTDTAKTDTTKTDTTKTNTASNTTSGK